MDLRSLYDVFGDMVIYRNLNPVDRRMPRYDRTWREIGTDSPIPPRKLDMAYAAALSWLLQRGRASIAPAELPIGEIVYIGDTMLNDGGAFRNLQQHTGLPGWCFIGSEKDELPQMTEDSGFFQANRWTALARFLEQIRQGGAHLDAATLAVVDVDKTALGARGRNDKSIDHARVAAIEATLHDAIGASFRIDEFRQAYGTLNVPRYHEFTADNQDNIAYICMMLSAGAADLESLVAEIDSGAMPDFLAFMRRMDPSVDRLPASVAALHSDIYRRTLEGDLTPFKAFRRREYRETVARMGCLPDDVPLAKRLVEEICITREVFEACEWLRDRGCWMVALSDKPDEATMPEAALVSEGYLPLHRTPTHVIGQALPIAGA